MFYVKVYYYNKNIGKKIKIKYFLITRLFKIR